ncbi:MAG: polyisoprenoid-binding protein [Azospira oryzae]|uniref:YceI family protein n=1 Tax=Pelomicrobium methylotrophicum TaxID=2602750 RepID=A0A5C7EVM0_9PROT|nr:MAG: polyisoprenoid-binding protein [Azospira oryzae]PZP79061.1 MAG: polyisoprenoid-binding protein [Azospira oryzae]TXF12397.1 YceI family protein [Pelomicrobium methylotrophicum]
MKTRWMIRLCVVMGALLTAVAWAQELREVDYAKSGVRFVGKQMGVPAEGAFRRFTARVAFDPARPEQGRAEVEIDVGSATVGDPEADAELKRKAWFDTAHHPTAKFVSTGFRKISEGRYEATGKLTIKGRTRDVVVNFTAKPASPGLELSGTLPIKRLDYGVGEGIWADTDTVANEVEIRFRLVLGPLR